MTGVNIHAIIEVPIYDHPLGILFVIGAATIMLAVFLVKWEIKGEPYPSCILAFVGVMLLALGVYFTNCETGYYNTYKVTIEENVSLVEFSEKYEILDQEGDIYTIRERK